MKKGLAHDFLVELHLKHLQPLGFKKAGRTFVRDKGTYTERFYFKSRGDLSCGQQFQLYVGVEFSDLPATASPQQSHPPNRGGQAAKPPQFSHVHWVAPAKIVVPETDQHRCATFKLYATTDYADLIREVAAYMPLVSDKLASEITSIRKIYVRFSQEQAPS